MRKVGRGFLKKWACGQARIRSECDLVLNVLFFIPDAPSLLFHPLQHHSCLAWTRGQRLLLVSPEGEAEFDKKKKKKNGRKKPNVEVCESGASW